MIPIRQNPSILHKSPDKLTQEELESTPCLACFLKDGEDRLSGNNYLIIWINIIQLKPFCTRPK